MFGRIVWFLFLTLLGTCAYSQNEKLPALVIHGGAGNISPNADLTLRDSLARAGLTEALELGYAVLARGGKAVDAVEAAIVSLENNPLFNAGVGAVMTAEGHHELDASVMDGQRLEAGAIAGVRHVKNPIRGAITVMEHSPHVMLSGAGADAFVLGKGLDSVANAHFTTEDIRERWRNSHPRGSGDAGEKQTEKFGTVGAVAIDADGNIAAGTSTGGMMNKAFGRIGDSPVIGAGTYADNNTCGVSCTGHGEYFIRVGVAKEISDRMAFGGQTLQKAVEEVVQKKLVEMGGEGGVIALDHRGNIVMDFNTPGMFRGYVNAQGLKVKIHGDE